MATYKALIMNHLDRLGVKYREFDEQTLSITYTGEKLDEIAVFVGLDEGAGKAEFICFSIGQFEQDQFAKALIACNTCNAKYRWVKFYVDDDNHICVRSDAILDRDTCGEECFELVQRMVNIVDDTYPIFMKARWA